MASNSVARQIEGGALSEAVQAGGSELRDFWILLKPNVMQLVVLTGWVGLYLAPVRLHPLLAFTAILCIALGAGASAAINNWFDADIDRQMARTRLRPTATGRIEPAEALGTGIALAILSVMTMGLAVNWAAAALLALTIGFYVLVYTMWLKRLTAQNIVIGGAAGAFPAMIGWAAATGEVGLLPVLIFLIVFFWTPPHFWALALYRCQDYARVGVPMLPVVAGRDSTRRHILGYTLVLAPLSLTPVAWGGLGLVYGAGAAVLGAIFVAMAWRLWCDDSDRTAMLTFRFSLAYLFLLFMLMVVDHALSLGAAS
ncbi:MAG TPA: heme o synthase [Geminicoccaceae bacterium]|nr:heme o synthase [Geminicoccus sp.]HMU49589.1 heme o synthase [Geminicoccaceae bacterium]